MAQESNFGRVAPKRAGPHGKRAPVVNVCLAVAPGTSYSVMVPASGEWQDFLASAGRKLGFELRSIKAVTRYDDAQDDLVEEDWRHGTLKHILDKDQLQIHTKMPDSDESEDDPSSDEERESLPGQKPPIKHWPYLDLWMRPAKCSKRFPKRRRTEAKAELGRADNCVRNGVYTRLANSGWVVHTCALPTDATEVALSSLLRATTAVILCQGGRFAGAIFDGEQCIAHKCYSRYVVRAKQGRRQGRFDKKQAGSRGGSHGAGSSIRRNNEAKLAAEIRATLEKWKDDLDRCARIFVFAPSPLNKALLMPTAKEFKAKGGWGLPEGKVRNIPFQPRRPTFQETKRVHAVLHRLYVDPDRC